MRLFHPKFKSQMIPAFLLVVLALFVVAFFSPSLIKRSATTVNIDLGLIPLSAARDRTSPDEVVIRRLGQELKARKTFLSRLRSRTFTVFRMTWYEGKSLQQASTHRIRYSEDFGTLQVDRNDGEVSYRYDNVTPEKIDVLAEESKSSNITIRDLSKYGCGLHVFKN